jgi:drug/metabolite transporter (DMT)-like permease
MSVTASSPARSLSLLDLAAMLFLGAAWGASFFFLRIAAPEVGPVWAAEIRLAVAAVVLLAVAGRRTLAAAKGRLIALLLVGALFTAVPFTLISFASLSLPAGFTALLNAATPLFTAVIAVSFMGQRLAPRAVAGLAVGVVAVVVLVGWAPFGLTASTAIAIAAGLGAPASYAVAGNYVRAKLSGLAPLELGTLMVTGGALVALPFAILSGPPGTPELDGVISLLAVGTISTAVAWPVYFRVLRRTSATAASTVTFVVPAFALLWGSMFLGETVGPALVVGFGLIFVSLVLVLGLVPAIPRPIALRSRPAEATAA